MRTKQPLIILSLAILIIGGVAYLNIDQSTVSKNFEFDAREFGFNLTEGGPTIKVKVGDTITIKLINVGQEEHELVIVSKETLAISLNPAVAELGKDEFEKVLGGHPEPVFKEANTHHVEPGETKIISFVAVTPGEYAYGCFLDDPDGILHAHLGMWGEFIVET